MLMADEKGDTVGTRTHNPWRSWRAIPLPVAAAVALVAWLRPVWLDSRPGSLIAATVTILALAAASVAFLQTRKLPLMARLLVVALALYAILAFVEGTVAGMTFGAMLRGGTAWQRLPAWLGGAFIGGCVVLPLAAVVQTLKTGLRGWRTSSSTAWRGLNQALVYAPCAATAPPTWTPSPPNSRPLRPTAPVPLPATAASG